jgi:DNA-binding beta-propeller fold protein YncE
MRRSWQVVLALATAIGISVPVAAQDEGTADAPPSLEYRPRRPALPEPKAPKPAPPVTIFRETIGGYGIGTESFDAPLDVAAAPDGSFYVLDSGNNRVQKFDGFSKFLLSWGASGTRSGEFDDPQAIAVDRGGSVYVVDTGNNRVQKFDAEGNFLMSWGSLGSRAGDFKSPRDIAFDAAGSIYVLDAGNDRVQKFDASTAFVSEWGRAFGSRGGVFEQMVSLAWTDDRFGYLYTLGAACLVQQFQLDGTLVNSWSAVAPESELCEPARIRIDDDNDYVYVLDSGNSLLMRFTRDGLFLAALTGADASFLHSRGFSVDPARDLVLVADTGNNVVQKFTLR